MKFRIPIFFQRGYTLAALTRLFLVCVFSTHLLALLLSFRDVSWVTERTRMWDAVGVVAHALLFSLLETILIFFILLALDLLLPRIWSVQKWMTSIGTMFLTLAAWAVVSQLYFLPAEPLVLAGMIGFLIHNGHPLRVVWGILAALVALSFAWPVYLIIRSKKALTTIKSFFDRLTVLSSVYLFLDLVGVVIVTI